LIKLSTHVATYKDSNESQQTGEFDLTVVIALENDTWDGRMSASEHFVALKFYVILTNKRDLHPKNAPARSGKFRTVSLPAASSPAAGARGVTLSGCSVTSGGKDNDSESDRSSIAATPPALDVSSTPKSVRGVGGNGSWTITRPPSVRQKSHRGYMGIKYANLPFFFLPSVFSVSF
jgi:hypothetical protein